MLRNLTPGYPGTTLILLSPLPIIEHVLHMLTVARPAMLPSQSWPKGLWPRSMDCINDALSIDQSSPITRAFLGPHMADATKVGVWPVRACDCPSHVLGVAIPDYQNQHVREKGSGLDDQCGRCRFCETVSRLCMWRDWWQFSFTKACCYQHMWRSWATSQCTTHQ